MKCSRIIIALMALFITTTSLFSQTLNDRLEQLSSAGAKAYLSPAVNTFGANINSGWFNKPPEAKLFGIDVELGVVGMGSYFNDNSDFFTTHSSFRFSREQAITLTQSVEKPEIRNQVIEQILAKDFKVVLSGPTITGSTSSNIKVRFAPEGTQEFQVDDPDLPFPVFVKLPSQTIDLGVSGVLDGLPLLPAAAPQLKLGTLYGSQAIIRWVPDIKVSDDFGKLGFFGVGLQHNPAVWFNIDLPVDLSAGFFYQNISVQDLLDINALSYGLNVSKNFNFGWFGVMPYAGFTMENLNMDVTYSQEIETDAGVETVNIKFNMDAQKKAGLNAGIYLNLSIVNLIFDYNLGNSNSFTGALTFNFGLL